MGGVRKRGINPREFYYITPLENLPSILEHGILSHLEIRNRRLDPTRIYDEHIVQRRQRRETPDKKSLWYYVNLYFQPRNPMLYRVLHEAEGQGREDAIVILGVDRRVLNLPGVWVTDGNAASPDSTFFRPEKAGEIAHMVADLAWWSEADNSKRRIMAEVLVPRVVPPNYIHTVYVPSIKVRERLLQSPWFKNRPLEVTPQPDMFFRPYRVIPLPGTRIRLVEGDMFFSRMQTLAISVNTVGVMGKGQASRVRFQFPDVYVAYQEACKRKILDIGKLVLYRREAPLSRELAEWPFLPPEEVPRGAWFLFFPTKRHWRERSRLEYVQQGLAWIRTHYQREGITSLALPALGCGLGGLRWSQVGPLMVQMLHDLDLEVEIYLPLETQVPEDQLRPEFLLPSSSRLSKA